MDASRIANWRKRLEKLKADLSAQYDPGKSSADTVVLDQSKAGRLSRLDARPEASCCFACQSQQEYYPHS